MYLLSASGLLGLRRCAQKFQGFVRFDRMPVSPPYSFAASRRGSASVLYALLSRNYSSINTVCWSVPPVLYFLAAARFRFQSPRFLICSSVPVILRFPMNSTRRLQRWFVSKLGPSPVTTAAKPFFSIFSDTTRSVPPKKND